MPDGRIKFDRVDDLVISGNRKVRMAPENEPRVEPSDAKSLERVETNRAGLLRGDGKGRIYRVTADGSTDRVIPENFPFKLSIQPASSPIPLTVTVIKDRKSKDEMEIAARNFYFYQGDSDPDRAGLQFLISPRNFTDLADQLHVTEGFVASLPNSPVLGDLRGNLKNRLNEASAAYDGGGPYNSLLEAQKIVATARKAFPADAAITQASDALDHRVEATLSAERTLLGLAAIEDWGTFLTTYPNIEANADSFPQLQTLHHTALEERTREFCKRGRALVARHNPAAALQLFAEAEKLDPNNPDIPTLADRTRMLTADREKGDGARNQDLSELRKHRENTKKEIGAALEQGDYAAAYQAANAGLRFDPDNPDLLYPAGVSAAVLRKAKESKQFLDSYLLVSDSLAADEAERKRARELQRLATPKSQVAESGTPNWFSGRKLPDGVYYCPTSLAFQIPFDSVAGYKFHMNFRWEHGRLLSIRSDFDDDKGREDYLGIVSRHALGSHVADAGNFTFVYDDSLPVVRSVYLGTAPKAKEEPGIFRIIKNDDKSYKLVDSSGYPRVLLPENPWVNLDVVSKLMGPAATVVSGNSFFNPFIWDGIHYFTVAYDDRGRASSANEWNADNLVRFFWEGERLVEIAAFHGKDREPYYRRSISYSGSNIGSEEYKSGLHSGHIKYNYSKNALTSVKVEDGGVHDGKPWVVRISERD